MLLDAGLGALSFSGVDDCVRALVPAHPLEADRRPDEVASQALYGGAVLWFHDHVIVDREACVVVPGEQHPFPLLGE